MVLFVASIPIAVHVVRTSMIAVGSRAEKTVMATRAGCSFVGLCFGNLDGSVVRRPQWIRLRVLQFKFLLCAWRQVAATGFIHGVCFGLLVNHHPRLESWNHDPCCARIVLGASDMLGSLIDHP